MSERGLLYSFVLLLFPFAAPTELCVASLRRCCCCARPMRPQRTASAHVSRLWSYGAATFPRQAINPISQESQRARPRGTGVSLWGTGRDFSAFFAFSARSRERGLRGGIGASFPLSLSPSAHHLSLSLSLGSLRFSRGTYCPARLGARLQHAPISLCAPRTGGTGLQFVGRYANGEPFVRNVLLLLLRLLAHAHHGVCGCARSRRATLQHPRSNGTRVASVRHCVATAISSVSVVFALRTSSWQASASLGACASMSMSQMCVHLRLSLMRGALARCSGGCQRLASWEQGEIAAKCDASEHSLEQNEGLYLELDCQDARTSRVVLPL